MLFEYEIRNENAKERSQPDLYSGIEVPLIDLTIRSCTSLHLTMLVGTPKLLAAHNIALQATEQEQLEQLQAQGKTVLAVRLDGKAAGLVAVADSIRATSKQVIAELQAMGIQVAMLTGDNKRTGEQSFTVF